MSQPQVYIRNGFLVINGMAFPMSSIQHIILENCFDDGSEGSWLTIQFNYPAPGSEPCKDENEQIIGWNKTFSDERDREVCQFLREQFGYTFQGNHFSAEDWFVGREPS